MIKRTELADPNFVPGMEKYEHDMLNKSTASGIRGKISDQHTLNMSTYNPSGLESLEKYVSPP